MVDQVANPAIDEIQRSAAQKRKSPYDTPAFHAHQELVQSTETHHTTSSADARAETTEVARGSKSDTRRLLRGLSVKDGVRVDPKALPKNNMMAMYKLMFQAARALKEFIEIERTEMKESNKNWKKHSDERAECSDKAYKDQNKWGNYTSYTMGSSVALNALNLFTADKSQKETITFISQAVQGLSHTIQQWSQGTSEQTTSAATKADYSKDSSRSEFDMNRDEMRQLEQAVDQIHSQLIELMRLEAKAYSRESG